ncbi:MAG TPA: tetratricopeptide repeat protein [Nitriliruptorales bacterium]|nr:tetratricopeptide repeat protein [Nitriliruptorales bacterium]
MTTDFDARLGELRGQLLRYRADRHPVEHATLQFHLGVTLLEAGRDEPASVALGVAAELFDPDEHAVEQAKALNMLGVAHRNRGDLTAAADSFRQAANVFEQQSRPLEHAAALFNLGLVQRDRAEHEDAVARFRAALDIFRAGGPPARSSAAARELGVTLLQLGKLDDAAEVLEEAKELARQAGELAALGAAANALGLAQLSADRADAAVEAFRAAVGAHPRTVRPVDYAMAKANLALAYERAGDAPRARLSARQALAVGTLPSPVTEQASALLARLPEASDDLLVVLDQEPSDRWMDEARPELTRWVSAAADERRAAANAWITGQLARDDAAIELAHAFLGVLLELPPEAMTTLIRATVEALQAHDPEDRRRFRGEVARAMARFHIPQWQRLQHEFERLAAEVGDDGSWT